MDDPRRSGSAGRVIKISDLPATVNAHELEGGDYGGLGFSLIVVAAGPGAGPAPHTHPYSEVFVVHGGTARFVLGDEHFECGEGTIVVGPPWVPHGFVNVGDDELRLLAIHGADRFVTDWIADVDPDWASPRPG